jgi:hypothetical protein
VEINRCLRTYVRKIKSIYIDLDPKVKVLEFARADIAAQAAGKDTKSSMTTSKSQLQQQPSVGGGTTSQAGQLVSGQSTSELKESSHQSISEKTLSISGVLRAESEVSLRDEGQASQDDLPEDLLKPLKILERLLAQSNYHKQQVKYKNYPFTVATKNIEEKQDSSGVYPSRHILLGGC